MYKDLFKTKGTKLTVKQLKDEFVKEFDEFTTNELFGDMNDADQALVACRGWAEERDGFTVIFAEYN